MIKVLIGIFFAILLSPLLLWGSQSQQAEKNFLRSQEISADTMQDGYVSIIGSATTETPLNCPVIKSGNETKPCLFVKSETLEYQTNSSIACGETPTAPTRIVKQVENHCDAEGDYCQTCYQVENDEWISLDKQSTFAPFQIGLFKITPSEKTNFIDKLNDEYVTNANGDRLGSEEKPTIGDKKFTFTYFPLPPSVLVAGLAQGGVIESAGDDGVFVISGKSRLATAESLHTQDKNTSKFFIFFSLILMMIGFALMVSPLTTWLRHVFGALLPGLDRILSRGTNLMIYLISGLLGGLIWLVLFLLILLVKNLLWVALLVMLIGLVIAIVSLKIKKPKV